MEVAYQLSPELNKRIRLYFALAKKQESWQDAILNLDEVKYLCEPHPSFLDFLIEKDDKVG